MVSQVEVSCGKPSFQVRLLQLMALGRRTCARPEVPYLCPSKALGTGPESRKSLPSPALGPAPPLSILLDYLIPR